MKESKIGIQYDVASSRISADEELINISNVGINALDVRGRRGVEIGLPQVLTQGIFLALQET